MSKELVLNLVFGFLWSAAEITLIVISTVKFGWAGFGLSFLCCFLIRVFMALINYIRGRRLGLFRKTN